MNGPFGIALFLSAALVAGKGFGDLPDKKQKNPGIARSGQSHDVHELEKTSFTVTSIATRIVAGGPVTMTYLKVATTADSDGDGMNDEAVLRIACAGQDVTKASLWSWGASNSGSHGRAAPPVAAGEWTAPGPILNALTASYLHKKLNRLHDKRTSAPAASGWVPVTLPDAERLCSAAAAATGEATTSRSNIKNN